MEVQLCDVSVETNDSDASEVFVDCNEDLDTAFSPGKSRCLADDRIKNKTNDDYVTLIKAAHLEEPSVDAENFDSSEVFQSCILNSKDLPRSDSSEHSVSCVISEVECPIFGVKGLETTEYPEPFESERNLNFIEMGQNSSSNEKPQGVTPPPSNYVDANSNSVSRRTSKCKEVVANNNFDENVTAQSDKEKDIKGENCMTLTPQNDLNHPVHRLHNENILNSSGCNQTAEDSAFKKPDSDKVILPDATAEPELKVSPLPSCASLVTEQHNISNVSLTGIHELLTPEKVVPEPGEMTLLSEEISKMCLQDYDNEHEELSSSSSCSKLKEVKNPFLNVDVSHSPGFDKPVVGPGGAESAVSQEKTKVQMNKTNSTALENELVTSAASETPKAENVQNCNKDIWNHSFSVFEKLPEKTEKSTDQGYPARLCTWQGRPSVITDFDPLLSQNKAEEDFCPHSDKNFATVEPVEPSLTETAELFQTPTKASEHTVCVRETEHFRHDSSGTLSPFIAADFDEIVAQNSKFVGEFPFPFQTPPRLADICKRASASRPRDIFASPSSFDILMKAGNCTKKEDPLLGRPSVITNFDPLFAKGSKETATEQCSVYQENEKSDEKQLKTSVSHVNRKLLIDVSANEDTIDGDTTMNVSEQSNTSILNYTVVAKDISDSREDSITVESDSECFFPSSDPENASVGKSLIDSGVVHDMTPNSKQHEEDTFFDTDDNLNSQTDHSTMSCLSETELLSGASKCTESTLIHDTSSPRTTENSQPDLHVTDSVTECTVAELVSDGGIKDSDISGKICVVEDITNFPHKNSPAEFQEKGMFSLTPLKKVDDDVAVDSFTGVESASSPPAGDIPDSMSGLSVGTEIFTDITGLSVNSSTRVEETSVPASDIPTSMSELCMGTDVSGLAVDSSTGTGDFTDTSKQEMHVLVPESCAQAVNNSSMKCEDSSSIVPEQNVSCPLPSQSLIEVNDLHSENVKSHAGDVDATVMGLCSDGSNSTTIDNLKMLVTSTGDGIKPDEHKSKQSDVSVAIYHSSVDAETVRMELQSGEQSYSAVDRSQEDILHKEVPENLAADLQEVSECSENQKIVEASVDLKQQDQENIVCSVPAVSEEANNTAVMETYSIQSKLLCESAETVQEHPHANVAEITESDAASVMTAQSLAVGNSVVFTDEELPTDNADQLLLVENALVAESSVKSETAELVTKSHELPASAEEAEKGEECTTPKDVTPCLESTRATNVGHKFTENVSEDTLNKADSIAGDVLGDQSSSNCMQKHQVDESNLNLVEHLVENHITECMEEPKQMLSEDVSVSGKPEECHTASAGVVMSPTSFDLLLKAGSSNREQDSVGPSVHFRPSVISNFDPLVAEPRRLTSEDVTQDIYNINQDICCEQSPFLINLITEREDCQSPEIFADPELLPSDLFPLPKSEVCATEENTEAKSTELISATDGTTQNDANRLISCRELETEETNEHLVSLCEDKAPGIELLSLCTEVRTGKLMTEEEYTKALQDNEKKYEEMLAAMEKEHEAKLAAVQEEIEYLQKQENNLRGIYTMTSNNISSTLSHFHTAVSSQKDATSEIVTHRQVIVQERDRALEDLQDVEKAFSELMGRYEKTKSVLERMKDNESVLKQQIIDLGEELNEQEEKYKLLQAKVEEKLACTEKELQKVQKENESEKAVLTAMIRRAEIKLRSLTTTLEQTIKCNDELSHICEEFGHKYTQ